MNKAFRATAGLFIPHEKLREANSLDTSLNARNTRPHSLLWGIRTKRTQLHLYQQPTFRRRDYVHNEQPAMRPQPPDVCTMANRSIHLEFMTEAAYLARHSASAPRCWHGEEWICSTISGCVLKSGSCIVAKEQSIKYQAVLFGDFSHIHPTEDTIKSCIGSFFSLGLLPTGSTQEFDPQTNKMEARLGLQSMRNGVLVSFLRSRIDIQAVPMPGSPAATLTFSEFTDQVKEISKVIYALLNPKVTRAGLVHEKFCKPMSEEEILSLRKKFLSESADIYPANEVTEWNVRACYTFVFEGLVKQPINAIHALNRVSVQLQEQNLINDFETIHIALDINTNPSQEIHNSCDAINEFFEQSFNKEQEIMKTLTEVIYGER